MSSLNLSMFRAYDIRTLAQDLTPALAERLLRAEARYFRETLGTNSVVLARDARLTGPAYLEQGIRLFTELGFTVHANPRVSSSCQFYYSCMRRPEAAGIMFGASHNPRQHTGQKVVGPKVFPIAEDIGAAGGLREIRRLYEADAGLHTPAAGGTLHLVDDLRDYLAYSMELAGVAPGSLRGCRILMDFLHGAAGEEFLRAFELAGATVDARNLVPDGHFPAGDPNPVVPGSVAGALAALKAGKYHFAMLFDGDGDRLDFIAPDGRQLSPGFNMAIIAQRIRAQFPGVATPHVYLDLKSNPLAQMSLASQGVAYRIIRNGHSQIKEALRRNWERGFLGAVEESSHYFLNFPLGGQAFPSENTLYYGLLTAHAWLQEPARYAAALREQETTFREREWGYVFPSVAARAAALTAVAAHYTARGAATMDRTEDGMDMEATLIRQGLPFVITPSTTLHQEWTQVSQRISQSENGLARWEVTAGTAARLSEAVALIDQVAKTHGAGERYRG